MVGSEPSQLFGQVNQDNRILRGGNTSTLSNKNPENKRRQLVVLSALIEYPGLGLILFETGCAEDLEVVCTMGPSCPLQI
jgi:hypothetical protein